MRESVWPFPIVGACLESVTGEYSQIFPLSTLEADPCAAQAGITFGRTGRTDQRRIRELGFLRRRRSWCVPFF